MTEPTLEQVAPWYERAAGRPRLRLLSTVAALFLSPFIFVFPLYWALDATYQNAREDCGGYDAGCYKRAIDDIRGETVYHCQVDRENPIPYSRARQLAEGVRHPCGVADPLSKVHRGASRWIRRRNWPMFREGFEFAEICNDKADKGGSISDKIHAHCKTQAFHFLRDEPVEPIAIYGEVRALFQETARRFEKAVADYERIRFLFGLLMWSWAALELAGFVLLLGILRADHARLRRSRAARRSGGG